MTVTDDKNPYGNNYRGIIAVDAACVAIVITCTGLRFYVRRYLIGKLSLDDWLLLAGAITYILSCFFDGAAWLKRQGEGVAHSDPGHLFELIDILAFLFAEILVRGAYTVFYLQIVPKKLNLRWQRYTLTIVYATYATFQFAVAFIYLFQCGNPKDVGKPTANTRCINPTVMSGLFEAIFYFDCIFDWLMVFIPIQVVWTISMKRATKVGTLLVLSLGCCAGALAIVVISLSHQQMHYSQVSGADMHLSIRIDMATTCEIMVAILCLSIATYRPLFRRWFDFSLESRRHSSHPCLTATTSNPPRYLPDLKDWNQRIDVCMVTIDKKSVQVESTELV